MGDQLLKSRLLAASLLALSTCGTLALFGVVPTIARILSADSTPQNAPRQAEQPPNWWFSEQPPLGSSDRS
jgi:hypothetical protein